MKRKSNKSGIVLLIILLILLATAFFTNPKKEAHIESLKTKLTEVINESMAERQDDVVTFGAWKLAGNQLIDGFVKNYASVDNYGVLSLTRLHWNNESYVVGVGGFGKVYITKRLNKDLADIIIDQIESTVNDSLPDILKRFGLN